MQCHCQYQFYRARQGAGHAFGLFALPVQVGDDVIQQQNKQYAEPESDQRRQKRQLFHGFWLLHGRDDQAPDGSSYHDPGSKSCEGALYLPVQVTPNKKYTAGSQRSSQKRNQEGL